ncbi:MAG: radical SAM protein [Myxococcales bacterium]|nr:radical SAM protein [Myxococcales bacterium]
MSADSPIPAVEWLSTQGCNLRCRHCAPRAGKPAPNELETAEVQALFGQLSEFGVERIHISGGEFTTRSDWHELLALALRSFAQVTLTTNALLGQPLGRALVEIEGKERLHVSVSLDGGELVHDRRRSRGSYAAALALLAEIGSLSKEIITTVARDNLGELMHLREVCLVRGVPCWTIQPGLAMGRLAPEEALDSAGRRALQEAVRSLQAEAGAALRIIAPPTTERDGAEPCRCGRDHVVIRPDGRVAACVFIDDAGMGDLRSQSFAEIWRGQRMRAFRLEAARGCVALSHLGAGASRAEGEPPAAGEA